MHYSAAITMRPRTALLLFVCLLLASASGVSASGAQAATRATGTLQQKQYNV